MTRHSSRRRFLKCCSGGLLSAGFSGTGAASLPAGKEFRRGGMLYRTLGHSDLHVSVLSFGSHTDPADRRRAGPRRTVLTEQGQARRDRIICRALDYGVNLFDIYDSEGQWEPAARLLKERRQKVLVSLAHEATNRDIDRACGLFGHIDLHRFHTAKLDSATLDSWDILRKAKGAGKVRTIGIATHIESTMLHALAELEGIDFIFFPYNFIHARADYGKFLPEAQRLGVGLIGMKPLASGSIMQLDPRARPGAKPEFEQLQLWQTRNRPILPAAVAELTKSLERLPDETLCMAAMRFVYSRPFLATAITGMFEERLLEDNYKALERHLELNSHEHAALDAARRAAELLEGRWLPEHYRWLEEQWSA